MSSLSFSPAVDEVGVSKFLSLGGLLQRVHAGDAHRQVRPVEVARPLLLAGERDRGDPAALSF